MTLKEHERAYMAIERHVRKHVRVDANGLCCKCHNAFDRLKDTYNKDEGSVEAFATTIARTCLFDESRGTKDRKCREKAYLFRQGHRRGELAKQSYETFLVREALSWLTPDQMEIILYIMWDKDLEELANERGISKSSFYERDVKAAAKAFAKEFGKAVGNEKWYAELRRQMKIKTKGGAK